MNKRLETTNGNIPDRLLELIMDAAKDVRDKYQENRQNDFYQGMAMAYTEVLDWIQDYLDLEDIESDIDYKQLAVEWFG